MQTKIKTLLESLEIEYIEDCNEISAGTDLKYKCLKKSANLKFVFEPNFVKITRDFGDYPDKKSPDHNTTSNYSHLLNIVLEFYPFYQKAFPKQFPLMFFMDLHEYNIWSNHKRDYFLKDQYILYINGYDIQEYHKSGADYIFPIYRDVLKFAGSDVVDIMLLKKTYERLI